MLNRIKNIFPHWLLPHLFLVGGAVRDLKSGSCTPHDLDFVAQGIDEKKLLGLGFKPVDPKSSIKVFQASTPLGKVEIAFPRREEKVGAGHRGFEFIYDPHMPIEEDLLRRDFTVNSMAIRLSDGQLVDPFGGLQDLKARVLRHTSPHFLEDPLRVFRLYRFSVKGFGIAPETVDFLKAHKEGLEEEIKSLPVERVWWELEKALNAPASERFFESLVEVGVGLSLFPELKKMQNVPAGRGRHGNETLLEHSLKTLRRLRNAPNGETKLAGFLHDIGKLATPPEEWPSHHGHDKKGEVIVESLLRRLRAPKRFVTTCKKACRFHMVLHRVVEMRPAKLLQVVEKIGGELDSLLAVCQADSGEEMDKKSLLLLNKAREILSLPARKLLPPEKLKGGAVVRERLWQARIKLLAN